MPSSSHFVCIARFVSKLGQETNLKKSLSELLKPTRAETGCVRYDLHADVENPRNLTMIEVFESQKSFEHHGKTPHLVNFKKIAGSLIENVQLTFCHTSNGQILAPAAEEAPGMKPKL